MNTKAKNAAAVAVQAGQIDIALNTPIEIDGAKVTSLRMREPLVSDQLAATKAVPGADDAQIELTLIANLCMVTVDDIARLTLRDYRRAQATLMGFID